MRENPIIAKKKMYPNGEYYYLLEIGDQIIGTAIDSDGGYLAHSRRKVVPTLRDAAIQCIQSKINQCSKSLEKWESLLSHIK